MLKMTKNATLTGRSMIDGKEVLYMSASAGDNTYCNQSITDFDLYMQHMTEVMTDVKSFMEEYQKIKQEFHAPKEEEHQAYNDVEEDLSK